MSLPSPVVKVLSTAPSWVSVSLPEPVWTLSKASKLRMEPPSRKRALRPEVPKGSAGNVIKPRAFAVSVMSSVAPASETSRRSMPAPPSSMKALGLPSAAPSVTSTPNGSFP